MAGLIRLLCGPNPIFLSLFAWYIFTVVKLRISFPVPALHSVLCHYWVMPLPITLGSTVIGKKLYENTAKMGW